MWCGPPPKRFFIFQIMKIFSVRIFIHTHTNTHRFLINRSKRKVCTHINSITHSPIHRHDIWLYSSAYTLYKYCWICHCESTWRVALLWNLAYSINKKSNKNMKKINNLFIFSDYEISLVMYIWMHIAHNKYSGVQKLSSTYTSATKKKTMLGENINLCKRSNKRLSSLMGSPLKYVYIDH